MTCPDSAGLPGAARGSPLPQEMAHPDDEATLHDLAFAGGTLDLGGRTVYIRSPVTIADGKRVVIRSGRIAADPTHPLGALIIRDAGSCLTLECVNTNDTTVIVDAGGQCIASRCNFHGASVLATPTALIYVEGLGSRVTLTGCTATVTHIDHRGEDDEADSRGILPVGVLCTAGGEAIITGSGVRAAGSALLVTGSFSEAKVSASKLESVQVGDRPESGTVLGAEHARLILQDVEVLVPASIAHPFYGVAAESQTYVHAERVSISCSKPGPGLASGVGVTGASVACLWQASIRNVFCGVMARSAPGSDLVSPHPTHMSRVSMYCDCSISALTGHGVICADYASVELDGAQVHNCAGIGIIATGLTASIRLHNVAVQNCTRGGIAAGAYSHIVAQLCNVKNCSHFGISCSGPSSSLQAVQISVSGCREGSAAVDCREGGMCALENVAIADCQGHAIQVCFSRLLPAMELECFLVCHYTARVVPEI